MAVKVTDLTHREYLAVLRQDFCAFIERSFYQINPQPDSCGTGTLRQWRRSSKPVESVRFTA
jgi:hypothetical protein